MGRRQLECDILCIESTYGGREHPDRQEEEARLVTRVKEVVSRGGVALIPARSPRVGVKTYFEYYTKQHHTSKYTSMVWVLESLNIG